MRGSKFFDLYSPYLGPTASCSDSKVCISPISCTGGSLRVTGPCEASGFSNPSCVRRQPSTLELHAFGAWPSSEQLSQRHYRTGPALAIGRTIVRAGIALGRLCMHAKVGIMHAKIAPEERIRDACASSKGFSGSALRRAERMRGAQPSLHCSADDHRRGRDAERSAGAIVCSCRAWVIARFRVWALQQSEPRVPCSVRWGDGLFTRKSRGTSGTVEEAPAAFRRVR